MVLMILTFIKKYWVYILVFLSAPLLYFVFKPKADENGNNAFEDFINALLENGYTFTLTPYQAKVKANLISNFLGTNADNGSYGEDEDSTVDVLRDVNNGDFKMIAYAYKNFDTNSRELITDLRSYLSSSQYNSLTHLFTRRSN